MTLRSRLLAAFAALAVVPLLGVGVFDYLRTSAAVHSLIVNQTSAIAAQAATDVESCNVPFATTVVRHSVLWCSQPASTHCSRMRHCVRISAARGSWS